MNQSLLNSAGWISFLPPVYLTVLFQNQSREATSPVHIHTSSLRACRMTVPSTVQYVLTRDMVRYCSHLIRASEPVRQVRPKPHQQFHLGIFEAMEYGLFGPDFSKNIPGGGPRTLHPSMHGRTNVEYLPMPLLTTAFLKISLPILTIETTEGRRLSAMLVVSSASTCCRLAGNESSRDRAFS